MPWATAIAAGTTAEAAAEVAERGDPTEAAIAGERAAVLYGLHVIAGDVGDHPEAYTRFVSVATHTRLDRAAGDGAPAFSFVTDHRPGALHRAIEPFARHGIDLVQLVSRPIPETPGGTVSMPCSPATRSTADSGRACRSAGSVASA